MDMKFVKSKHGKTYYWIEKHHNPEAKCIFFLPGLTADHTLFDKQIPHFKKDYTVIVWDAPCHGKSRPYSEFTFEHVAEELKEILIINHIKSTILVGQSIGGFIGQVFLSKYPLMVEAFIAIGSFPSGHKYYAKLDIWLLQQMEWMTRFYSHKFLLKSLAKSSTTSEYGYQNTMDFLATYTKLEICNLMGLGFGGFAKENQDIIISCPVLILRGEHDNIGKVKQYCLAWHICAGRRCRTSVH